MLDNTLYLLLGAVLGFVAGWSLRTMRYARRASNEAHHVRRIIERDDEGIAKPTVALGLAVALTATAAILTGVAAQRSSDATDRVESLAVCTQDILQRTVRALNQRTELTDKQTTARNNVLTSQRDLVDALLDPATTDATLIELATTYRTAVGRQVRLDKQSEQRRADNPYPSVDEIQGCD